MEDKTKFKSKSDRDKLNGLRILEQDDLNQRYQTALDEVWTETEIMTSHAPKSVKPPENYNEAKVHALWRNSMEKEVKGLSDKLMIKLFTLPDYEVLFVTPKFVFKVKPGESLENTYKSRLTGKGYEQIFGLHYDMTYAETVKMTTVRMFFVMAAYKHLHLGEFDWEQAFIQADIDKEIWLKVNDKRCPLNEFFKIQEGYGLKVMKSWYGLKQADHLWRQFVDDLILKYDFKLVKNEFDVCQYTCTTHPDGFTAILLFVDNAIVATTTLEQRAEFFEYYPQNSKSLI